MSVHHLFNSRGEWIAFRVGSHIFDLNGNWVGWMPWPDTDIVDRAGHYLATIYDDNRLICIAERTHRAHPVLPHQPDTPGIPDYPSPPGPLSLPAGATDVVIQGPARCHLWTWSGRFFGYREGTDLWTADGRHVGRFHGDDVYDRNGQYLGELLNGRLVTITTKRSQRQPGFSPAPERPGMIPFAAYAKNAMYTGYEDFPEL